MIMRQRNRILQPNVDDVISQQRTSHSICAGDMMAADWVKSRRERIVAAVQARDWSKNCKIENHVRSPEESETQNEKETEMARQEEGLINKESILHAVDVHVKEVVKDDVDIENKVPSCNNVTKPIESCTEKNTNDACGEQLYIAISPTSNAQNRNQAHKKIIVDFDNMFSDNGDNNMVPKAKIASKSKCVKKIEDIEKRRRERRNSAKHAMQMKENNDGVNHDLLNLVEKSKATCGVLDYDCVNSSGKDGLRAKTGEDNRSKVSVFIRKRPLNAKEYNKETIDCVSVGKRSSECSKEHNNGKSKIQTPSEKHPSSTRASDNFVVVHEPKVRVDLRKEVEQHKFQFDGAFSAAEDTDKVYSICVSPIVRASLLTLSKKVQNVDDSLEAITPKISSGGTVFAYGQTGSGKTFTMQRITKHAVDEVFQIIEKCVSCERKGAGGKAPKAPNVKYDDEVPFCLHRESKIAVFVSCYEIYSGKVFDLLGHKLARNDDKNMNPNRFFRNNHLPVREDARGNVSVVGLSKHYCLSAEEVLKLTQDAEVMRATGTTTANDMSSRSHYIFQLEVKLKKMQEPQINIDREVNVFENDNRCCEEYQCNSGHDAAICKLRLVDLAGSERGADTSGSDRKTRIEGAEINKSLLALKECIRALDSSNSYDGPCNGNDDNHIPFRGCRLTHLLRDAFVHNSKKNNALAVLACIAPGSNSVEHSLNTLRYAAHIKEFSRESNSNAVVKNNNNFDDDCGKNEWNNFNKNANKIVRMNENNCYRKLVRMDVLEGKVDGNQIETGKGNIPNDIEQSERRVRQLSRLQDDHVKLLREALHDAECLKQKIDKVSLSTGQSRASNSEKNDVGVHEDYKDLNRIRDDLTEEILDQCENRRIMEVVLKAKVLE